MKNDFLLLMHELAYENISSGVSYNDVTIYLKKNGIKISGQQLESSIALSFSQIFIDSNRASIGLDLNNSRDVKYYMLPDAYFRYLEYLELVESRKNAFSAKRQALIAIILTFIALIASIIIGVIQIIQKSN